MVGGDRGGLRPVPAHRRGVAELPSLEENDRYRLDRSLFPLLAEVHDPEPTEGTSYDRRDRPVMRVPEQ